MGEEGVGDTNQHLAITLLALEFLSVPIRFISD